MNKPGAKLQALMGFAWDVFSTLRFDQRNPHSLSKYFQILAVRRRTGAEVLIETGTFRGVTTSRCARHFNRVITVEIDPTLYAESSQYLEKHANVRTVLGDATVVLPKVLAEVDCDSILVFLDGHFSGGVTGSSTEPEPALLELEILAEAKSKVAGIIIDDFRSFVPDSIGPSKADLLAGIERFFKEYRTVVSQDQVLIERLSASGL